MTNLRQFFALCTNLIQRGAWLAFAFAVWAQTSPLLAAAKRKEAAEAGPTKSYTVSYLIVIMMVGLGLMTLGRPSRRADKPPDPVKKEDAQ